MDQRKSVAATFVDVLQGLQGFSLRVLAVRTLPQRWIRAFTMVMGRPGSMME